MKRQAADASWTLTHKRREAIAGYLFLAPYLVFFLVFLAGPVISAFVTAFVEWELLRGTYRFIGLENFQLIMEDDLFWTAMRNSFGFAVMTTVGNVIVALCAALALKSIRLGHTLFRVVMYAPVVLSISVIGIVFSRLLAPFGLLNAGLELFGHNGFNYLADPHLVLPSLSLTTIWWGFGFPMLIFLAALYAVPEALYEAARIDGASRWQILWQVTLPLIRPALSFHHRHPIHRPYASLRPALYHDQWRRSRLFILYHRPAYLSQRFQLLSHGLRRRDGAFARRRHVRLHAGSVSALGALHGVLATRHA